MFAQGLLQERLQSLKQETKPAQWLWCNWVGIQVCKLLKVAPQWMWGWFLLYTIGGKQPEIRVKWPSSLQGRARGKAKGWASQKNSTGNQLTNKLQEQEHALNPVLSQEWNAFFHLGFTDLKPPLQDLDAYSLKKTSCHTLYGDDTSTCFCTAARQSRVLIENTGLDTILLSDQVQIFPSIF